LLPRRALALPRHLVRQCYDIQRPADRQNRQEKQTGDASRAGEYATWSGNA
jgi:hypothetical protein